MCPFHLNFPSLAQSTSYGTAHTNKGSFRLLGALLQIHSCFFSHSIGGLPLSPATVSLHYPSTVWIQQSQVAKRLLPYLEIKLWIFVATWLLGNRGQSRSSRSQVSPTCHWRQRSGHERSASSLVQPPEQWIWFLCSVSVIPANRHETADVRFSSNVFFVPISRGRFVPPSDD